ncbi:hypothetical protein D3C81_1805440 [compost metagenome]
MLASFIQLGKNPALLFANGIFNFGQRHPFRCGDAQAIVIDHEADGAALGTNQRVIQDVLADMYATLAMRYRRVRIAIRQRQARQQRPRRALGCRMIYFRLR